MFAGNERDTDLPDSVEIDVPAPGTVCKSLSAIGCRFSIHATSVSGRFCRATFVFIFLKAVNVMNFESPTCDDRRCDCGDIATASPAHRPQCAPCERAVIRIRNSNAAGCRENMRNVRR